MRILAVFLALLFIAGCASSSSVNVTVERLDDTPRSSSESVELFVDAESIQYEYVEIARLQAVEFTETDDPEDMILEAMRVEAKSIGADGLLIVENESSIQARRDMQVGGISVGTERTIETLAISFH